MRYYICSTFNPNYSETIPDFIKQWCVEEECIYSESVPEEIIKNELDPKERRLRGWEDDYYDKLAKKIGEVKYVQYDNSLTKKKRTYWEWDRKGKRYYIEMDQVDADLISMFGGKVDIYDTDRFEEDGVMSTVFGKPAIEGMVMEIDNGERPMILFFNEDHDDDDYEDDPFEQQ